MPEYKRNGAIIASGMAVPDRIIPNRYFNELLGEDVDTWLRNNVQIYNRRWLSDGESMADLIESACLQAMERGGVQADDIDLIIVATDTPEYISPATASVLQYRLGLKNAGTFDLNAACAGFVTALDTASKYIQADSQYRYVLVVGAYAMSRFLNVRDKKTATLFADGAAAVILKAETDGRGLLQSQLAALGEYSDWMGIYAGGSHQPVTSEVLEAGGEKLQFVQKIPTEINPARWEQMIRTLCEREGISAEDVNHFFFTQININTIWQTLDALEVPRERAEMVMHEYGYTGSAAIPMAFDARYSQHRIKAGDLAVFMGSGGGLAFGAALFRM